MSWQTIVVDYYHDCHVNISPDAKEVQIISSQMLWAIVQSIVM